MLPCPPEEGASLSQFPSSPPSKYEHEVEDPISTFDLPPIVFDSNLATCLHPFCVLFNSLAPSPFNLRPFPLPVAVTFDSVSAAPTPSCYFRGPGPRANFLGLRSAFKSLQ